MPQPNWKTPLLFFCLGVVFLAAVLFAILTWAAFQNDIFFDKYVNGLALGGIFLTICAFISLIFEKIRLQERQYPLIDTSQMFENLRCEINIHAIELKERLNRIEEKEENIEQNLQNINSDNTSTNKPKELLPTNIFWKVIGFIILFTLSLTLLAIYESWAIAQSSLNPVFRDAGIVLVAAILGGVLSNIYYEISQKATSKISKNNIQKNESGAFLVAVFIIGILIGIVSGYFILAPQKNDMQKLDESYHILNKNFIHDAGKEKIDKIVNKTSPLGKDPTRLSQIASLITSDFTDPNWAYQMNDDFFCYYPNGNPPYNYCLIGINEKLSKLEGQSYSNVSIVSDKLGHIRQGYGTDLSADPYWIAFQKTGECQELSVFFNKVTNESGFVTRTVSANGTRHIWNEVFVDGDWKYFDVQKYGEVRGEGNPSQWFGNRSNYSINTNFSLDGIVEWGVCVHDWQKNADIEDVTLAYDPTNRSTHGRCKISD